mmetsp:Transcript_60997/g.145282  ORF Transcript_60997/g.145282 Transcript_60997/m.145282 type:complete len:243 (-) Transcript_60997:237-965(-)
MASTCASLSAPPRYAFCTISSSRNISLMRSRPQSTRLTAIAILRTPHSLHLQYPSASCRLNSFIRSGVPSRTSSCISSSALSSFFFSLLNSSRFPASSSKSWSCPFFFFFPPDPVGVVFAPPPVGDSDDTPSSFGATGVAGAARASFACESRCCRLSIATFSRAWACFTRVFQPSLPALLASSTTVAPSSSASSSQRVCATAVPALPLPLRLFPPRLWSTGAANMDARCFSSSAVGPPCVSW